MRVALEKPAGAFEAGGRLRIALARPAERFEAWRVIARVALETRAAGFNGLEPGNRQA